MAQMLKLDVISCSASADVNGTADGIQVMVTWPRAAGPRDGRQPGCHGYGHCDAGGTSHGTIKMINDASLSQGLNLPQAGTEPGTAIDTEPARAHACSRHRSSLYCIDLLSLELRGRNICPLSEASRTARVTKARPAKP